LIADRLALVAEWARHRQLHARSTDVELFDLVAAGLEAQLHARRQSGSSHRHR
jgi:hypothetical protein